VSNTVGIGCGQLDGQALYKTFQIRQT